MALSDFTKVSVTEAHDLIFYWEAHQDAVRGVSRVDWELRLQAGERGRIDATFGSGWAVTIDGQAFSGATSIAIAANTTKVLASGSVELQHDENGQTFFMYNFSQEFYMTYGGEYIQIVSGMNNGILTPIDPDAAPVVDRNSVYLGQPLTITPQGQLGATFQLRYQLGSAEGIIGEALTGPVTWVVPEELGAQIPYTDRGSLRILCDTFRDGARLGRVRETAVTALVPETAIPQVEELTITDLGQDKLANRYLGQVSRLEVEARCVGAMGSKVANTALFLDESPYYGQLLEKNGVHTLRLAVTDSRGRVGIREEILTVEDYAPPQVWVTAHRCLADGTADDTGGFAKITVEAGWTGLEGNQGLVTLVAGNVVERWDAPGVREVLVEADPDIPMDISVTAADLFASASHQMVLSTGYCTLDLLYGGRGIAFGAAAQEPGFLCAMDARFTGKLFLTGGKEMVAWLTELEEKLDPSSLYQVTFRNGELYIKKAPAVMISTMLSLSAGDQ